MSKTSFFSKERGFNFNKDELVKEDPIQIGYMYLPEGEVKTSFEKKCRKFNSYAIVLESGTIKKNCVSCVDKPLRVPENSKYMGDMVLVVFPNTGEIPLIIKVLKDSVTDYKKHDEHSVSKIVSNDNTSIQITEDITNRLYSVSIASDSDEEVTLNLNVSALNKKGKLRINVNGDCDIFAEKDINILANNQVNLKIRDLTKEQKFHEILYNFQTGLKIKDKWDNEITLNEQVLKLVIKNDVRVIAKNVSVVASNEVKIQTSKPNSIHIGNASSLALNQETICCFTGQQHFIPLTNTKTKV